MSGEEVPSSGRQLRRRQWWQDQRNSFEERTVVRKNTKNERSTSESQKAAPVLENVRGFKSKLVDTMKLKLTPVRNSNPVKSANKQKKATAQNNTVVTKKEPPKLVEEPEVVAMVTDIGSFSVYQPAPITLVPKTYVLFIGNLPYDITREQLEEHFRKTGNLPYDITREQLEEHFRKTGARGVKSIRIPKEKGTDKGRGFAYMEFKDRISHGIALRLHQTKLGGRRINVEFTPTGGKKKREEALRTRKQKKLSKSRSSFRVS